MTGQHSHHSGHPHNVQGVVSFSWLDVDAEPEPGRAPQGTPAVENFYNVPYRVD